MKLVENYDQERKGEKFVWQNKLAVVKVAVLIYNGKKILKRFYREKQEEDLEERISYCH